MVDACIRKGAKVVLCTAPPINSVPYFKRHKKEDFAGAGGLSGLLATYRDAVLRVAGSHKLPVVDLNQALAKEPAWMSSDGVHPSKKGNAIIAKHVAKAVRPLLEKPATGTPPAG